MSALCSYFARATDLGKFRGMQFAIARRGPILFVKAKIRGGLVLKNIFAIGAILLLSTTSTMAAVPKECAADVKAQCGGVQPGAGRIRACINSHLKDLTPTCQTILVRAAAIGKACRGDVRKICAGVKPGGGRIEACIRPHLTELSASCQFDIIRAFHAD